MIRRFWGALAALLLLALLGAPTATADGYTDALVGKFTPTNHVQADTSATPPLLDPAALNDRILGLRDWNGQTPASIWVAVVAPNQTGVTTPEDLWAGLRAKGLANNGIFEVIDKDGYHAIARNVPKAVADAVDPLIHQAARNHRHDPDGATQQFVADIANANTVVPASGGSAPHHFSWTWLWVFGYIIAAIVVIGLIVAAVLHFRSKRADRESVHSDLIDGESKVNDLATVTMVGKVDVSTESTKAGAALADAKAAYASGDYSGARAHLRTLAGAYDKAETKINPDYSKRTKANLDALDEIDPDQRQRATITATDPRGTKRVIDNNNYKTRKTTTYNNYYGGGYLNGAYFYPGWYPYAFWGPGWGWSPTDVVVADALLHDRWDGDYDYTPASTSASSSYSGGSDSGSSSSYSGSSSSSSSDSDYSGGYSSSSSSSYTPSYDSGSSSGFSDFGGGGGGGFDGGGSSGF